MRRAADVLRVDVGLRPEHIRVGARQGQRPPVVPVGVVGPAEHRGRDDEPGVGVAEDPAVLLGAGRIRRGAADALVATVVWRPQHGGPVGRREQSLGRLERALRPLPRSDLADDGPGLRVQVDPVALLGRHPDRQAVVVERPGVPGAVPGDGVDDAGHLGVEIGEASGVGGPAHVLAHIGEVQDGAAEQHRGPDALRPPGPVVDVEGVVPVGEAGAGQAVRPPVRKRELDRPQHVRPDGRVVAVGPRDDGVEISEVARLAKVGARREDQPQVVVREPLGPGRELRGEPRAAVARERKDLVPRVAVEELQRQRASERPACLRGQAVHRPQDVLGGVPGSHAATQARLVAGDEARPVERRPALDLVPRREHLGHLGIGRHDREASQVGVPVGPQGREGAVDLRRLGVPGDHPGDLLGAVCHSEDVDQPAFLARPQLEVVRERSNRVSTRRARVRGLARLDDDRRGEIAAAPHEVVPVAGPAARRLARPEERGRRAEARGGKDRVALPPAGHDVLRPVQVLLVAQAVEIAELGKGEGADAARGSARVPDARHPQLARAGPFGGSRRHEVEELALDPVERAPDPRVARPVTALVIVEGTLHGLPGRAPEASAGLVAQVKVAAGLVRRDRVVAVARRSTLARVPVEREAARGVRDDPAIPTLSEVVEPGRRGVRPGDHVLVGRGVHVAVWRAGRNRRARSHGAASTKASTSTQSVVAAGSGMRLPSISRPSTRSRVTRPRTPAGFRTSIR